MTNPSGVRAHYFHDWGEPDREAEFSTENFVIGVLKWSSRVATQGVNIYATLGGSDYPVPGFDPAHRQEFFVGLDPERDEIASPLARLAIHGQLTGRSLGAGHTFRVVGGLLEGSAFGGFFIMAPLDGLPAPVKLHDGRHVEFLMAVPAFDDELEFVASRGVDELLTLMESARVPFWNPGRRSVFDE